MTQFRSLLVGSYFRPPASHVLAQLPAGTPLQLRPEPDNPYDEAALRVLVSTDHITHRSPEFTLALASCGWTLEDLIAEEEIWLGYVAATGGKPLTQATKAGITELVGNRELSGATAATLGFDARGEPLVVVERGGDSSAAE